MNKKRYIDLSWPISNGMPVYPGDSAVQLIDMNVGKKDVVYEQYVLNMSLHAGTHIDGPAHVRADSKKNMTTRVTYISDISLDRCAGNGCILDVHDMHSIGYDPMYESMVHENDVVLLYTGYAAQYGSAEYYAKHPVITKQLAQFFVDKKVRCVGIDAPSVEKVFDSDVIAKNFDTISAAKIEILSDIHTLLLASNILILENLRNLDKLIDVMQCEVFFFPLKIAADSSPVRVVARI